MRPPESFIGQSIRSLQTMLRVIAQSEGRDLSVIPDGIYGPQTMQEVTAFQRRRGLPINGQTDQATWDAIYAAYQPALIQVAEVMPVCAVMNPNQVILAGEAHPIIFLSQAMLGVLSQVYHSVSMPGLTGILDIPTQQALRQFQELSLLPSTGTLDRMTWHCLANHYPLASNLQTNSRKK